MEALNAVGLTPISVLSDRRSEPRKTLSLSSNPQLKFINPITSSTAPSNFSEGFSRNCHKGLVLVPSVLSNGVAKALTYEEALQQSMSSITSDIPFGVDVSGIVDSVVNFGVENPAVIAGGVVILALPLLLSLLFNKPKSFGVESAKTAYAKLGDEPSSQLLDIRAPVEFRKVGSPDIRGLKKKPVAVAYKGDDKLGFLKKLSLKFKEPENITLFILDKFDGNSELVAELVTSNGFKAAFAIRDGAEGPRGWLNSGLPWLLPNKTLSLASLTDAVTSAFGVCISTFILLFIVYFVLNSKAEGDESETIAFLKEDADLLVVGLGAVAAAGLGFLAFSEVETLLQLVGFAALIQIFSKRLLFAEERKQTLQQIDEFLNTKVAPKDLVDEIKQIGIALLPSPANSKTLPPPAEVAESTVQEALAAPQMTAEPKAEKAPEPAPAPVVNSVPMTEVKAESLPGLPRPLSPYPSYPDWKPPTSPTPSQP
ncbi:hypothetical protein RJ641_016683 [Dillenia turbinata]|uniref:Rhodanese domain-containing protein n=1 Tax=Dillenia turbinata TaxID=194707 RepID=A0AAN8UUD5_9MAGN